MEKRLKLKQSVKNYLILGIFYLIIIIGILMINIRVEQVNNQKKTEIATTIQSKNENFVTKIS